MNQYGLDAALATRSQALRDSPSGLVNELRFYCDYLRSLRRARKRPGASRPPRRARLEGSGTAAGVFRSYPITSSAVISTPRDGAANGVAKASCTCGLTPGGRGLLCQSPKSPPSFWLSNCARSVVPSMEKKAFAAEFVVKLRAPALL